MESTVAASVLGLLGVIASALIGAAVGRGKRRAESASLMTAATQAVQDTYQQLLADVQAQATAARQEATSAKSAARESAQAAQDAEAEAWRAVTAARSMARFLVELRPLIAQHVPGAEPILERLDKLTTVVP